MSFEALGLRPEILIAVSEAGYTAPTPIQERAVPAILEGADVLAIAQTGTGKTAAFVLPMIELLAQGQAKARMPRSMILSPTRELATQTAKYFETYGRNLKLSMALLIGGVGMDEQARLLERGVDVLIATPGRLLDQFERGRILLGGVNTLVIDEADRMLDMGFIPDIERILKLLINRRQTLMFSATMPKEVRRLANTFLKDAREITIAPPATTAEGVRDCLTVVPPRQKFKALRRLIESQEVGKAIIFCNRKREVSSLCRQLVRAGLNVRDIHGDLDQSQRDRALAAFKSGEIDFLVATDVAARGLDITALPCVINYDIPTNADDYVHRIGRTGRAGREGRAFTLALPEETKYVGAITRLTGRDIPRLDLEGFVTGAVETEERPARNGRRRPRPVNGDGATAATARAVDPVPAESAAPDDGERAADGGDRAAADSAAADRRSSPGRDAGRDAGRDESRSSGDRERTRRRREPRREPAEPVVGMGDHVPLFMLRPLPAAASRKPEAE